MKKNMLTAIFFFLFFTVFAQDGGIVFSGFNPDSCFTFQSTLDTFMVDIDQNGQNDIVFSAYFQSGVGLIVSIQTTSYWQWSWAYKNPWRPLNDSTLINNESLRWETGSGDLLMYPDFTHFAFRCKTNEDWFYGWGLFFIDPSQSPQTVCASRIAFCTIPNYPLRWGQTELTEDDVIENNGNGSFTIHPNPSSGVFIVTGENLKHIDIYDVLGQKVSSLNADADHTTIDLGDRPAGIYLISVTEHDGKHHTRQIVKK